MLDDAPNSSQKRLRQFPSTPIEFTKGLYNLEGDIIVQRSDIDDDYCKQQFEYQQWQ